MTKVLKYSNREWFAGELEQYLEKLKTAKDSFFQNLEKEEDKSEDDKLESVFSFETQSQNSSEEDPDAITLQQIAHQYSEIENILRTVKSFVCKRFLLSYQEVKNVINLFLGISWDVRRTTKILRILFLQL
jgi:ATP-dependent helicase/DNAse subunit B